MYRSFPVGTDEWMDATEPTVLNLLNRASKREWLKARLNGAEVKLVGKCKQGWYKLEVKEGMIVKKQRKDFQVSVTP